MMIKRPSSTYSKPLMFIYLAVLRLQHRKNIITHGKLWSEGQERFGESKINKRIEEKEKEKEKKQRN